ncbi:hypothetical protein BCR33DRAFT_479538 [Rhizoclosmatium globosum]|uniref:Uncharacterized protein n=1 Tax=Rhizoclosmatium globosum TaxID=329046 RepID=A0A1Y2BNF6_9FUNG|nr:hypothetical protein BCR33DRAFT_479538 [Rhizoclosmatium globosum]|eukprot:ORY36280.1 hypothetical protein BCR33DRAFT_479538 [Rhizoclosmatium globosum]
MDEYQQKYNSSMEERLKMSESVRFQQAKAIALSTDLALLHSEVESLKKIVSSFGLPAKPSVQDLARYALDYGTSTSGRSVFDPDYEIRPEELIPWLNIVRVLFPNYGPLLRRPQQRQIIDESVKEFLETKLETEEDVEACRIATPPSTNTTTAASASGATPLYSNEDTNSHLVAKYHALPKELVSEFKDWIEERMDDLIESYPKSPASEDGAYSATARHNLLLQQQQQQRKAIYSMPARGHHIAQDSMSGLSKLPTEIVSSLHFPTPVPPILPSGAPNVEQFRAWTDVIRARHKTFQRATPPMSKHARLFLQNKKLPVLCLVPGSSVRISKATFAIPGALHDQFLAYMEAAFLKGGVFGEKALHSAAPRRIVGGGPGWDDVGFGSGSGGGSVGGGSNSGVETPVSVQGGGCGGGSGGGSVGSGGDIGGEDLGHVLQGMFSEVGEKRGLDEMMMGGGQERVQEDVVSEKRQKVDVVHSHSQGMPLSVLTSMDSSEASYQVMSEGAITFAPAL